MKKNAVSFNRRLSAAIWSTVLSTGQLCREILLLKTVLITVLNPIVLSDLFAIAKNGRSFLVGDPIQKYQVGPFSSIITIYISLLAIFFVLNFLLLLATAKWKINPVLKIFVVSVLSLLIFFFGLYVVDVGRRIEM